jgi:hypothetical protein
MVTPSTPTVFTPSPGGSKMPMSEIVNSLPVARIASAALAVLKSRTD